MHDYIQPLIESFKAHADAETAAGMSKYLRDQFAFFGIKTPARKALIRAFVQEYGNPPRDGLEEITRDLWGLPQRECQYSAMTLLERVRRLWTPDDLPLFEELIITKSWWDTVDLLATHMIGRMFETFPERQGDWLPGWRASDNIWLRRTGILFQLHYKKHTNFELLQEIILENRESREFFIQKAIGWALREYSKTDAPAVIRFVEDHTLAPLSAREALKWLKNRNLIS